MDFLIGHWWQLTLITLMVLSIIYLVLLTVSVSKLKREVEWTNVHNTPRAGFPEHMEASWEDVGAHGRYLTDLGGMSIKMREQMLEEFIKALNTPMLNTPAAGSYMDVMLGIDEWLTKQERD